MSHELSPGSILVDFRYPLYDGRIATKFVCMIGADPLEPDTVILVSLRLTSKPNATSALKPGCQIDHRCFVVAPIQHFTTFPEVSLNVHEGKELHLSSVTYLNFRDNYYNRYTQADWKEWLSNKEVEWKGLMRSDLWKAFLECAVQSSGLPEDVFDAMQVALRDL